MEAAKLVSLASSPRAGRLGNRFPFDLLNISFRSRCAERPAGGVTGGADPGTLAGVSVSGEAALPHGAPVAGHATLKELADARGIRFGGAIPHELYLTTEPWMRLWAQSSNCFGLGNAKPRLTRPDPHTFDFANQFAVLDAAEAWAGTRLPCMLYVLIYPSFYPDWWVEAMTPGNWRALIREHITGMAPLVARAEKVQVANETIHPGAGPAAYGGPQWRETPSSVLAGRDGTDVYFMFERARRSYPGSRLYISENYLEHDNLGAKRGKLLAALDVLQERGLVDGVALQGHLTQKWPFTGGPFREFLRELIGRRGLDVCITEFDIANPEYPDPETHARIARDWTERLFSIAFEEGVSWTNCWGMVGTGSWVMTLGHEEPQTPLPFDGAYRPTAIEHGIRAALLGRPPTRHGD